jgi:dTDP-4-amino-4,6-dideoxygalactose transaminase
MPLALPRHNINFNGHEYLIVLKAAFRRPAHSRPVEEFENTLAAYLGVKHCVAFSSGSAALYHGLTESPLKKGDKIIVPSYEFSSVVETIRLCGFFPVFAPVARETGNLVLRGIKESYREGVRAVLVADIHGLPADLPEIASWCRENKVLLIEDCAHALGSTIDGRKAGSFGDFSIFSFGSGKPLTTCTGGVLATSDSDIAGRLRERQKNFTLPGHFEEAVRLISTAIKALLSTKILFSLILFPLVMLYAWFTKKIILDELLMESSGTLDGVPVGYTSHFTDTSARIGLSQLERIEDLNHSRYRNAYHLRQRLANSMDFFFPPADPSIFSTCLNLVVEVNDALPFRLRLLSKGIDTRPDYLLFYEDLSLERTVPTTRLYLPNHPGLSLADMSRIARAVEESLA